MCTNSAKVWLSSLFFLFTMANAKINDNLTAKALQYHFQSLNEVMGSQCLPIEEPSCLGLEYTHTYLPNIIGLTSQTESTKRIRDYGPLIKMGCSTYLEFFLCSVYFPMCTESMGEQVHLRPCASFCIHVRQCCAPLMLRFNFPWPEELDCSRLPTDDEMCIRPHSFDSDIHLPITSVSSNGEILRNIDGASEHDPSFSGEFTSKEKEFAKYCLIAFTAQNALFCLTSISLYVFHRSRFVHPLQPLIFLTNACMLEIISYLPQLLFQSNSFPTTDANVTSIFCMIQFALAYYARTAMGIWFVIVSLSWFLSACKGWAPEAIGDLNRWFHVLGWVTSLPPPLFILIFRRIDVDALTSSCYIGHSDKVAHLLFVMLPEGIFLLVGVTFLAAALVSLVRFHCELKSLYPAPSTLAMKAVRASVNRKRLLKAVKRVILTFMFVAGPLLLRTICDTWQYFDKAPRRMAVRLLKAVSIEIVGTGTTMVLWCNRKTFLILCPAPKTKEPLDADNLTHFRPIAPTGKESINSMSIAPLVHSQRTSTTEYTQLLLSRTKHDHSTALLSHASQLHQPPMRRLVSPHNEAKLRDWLCDNSGDIPLTSTSYSLSLYGHPAPRR